MKAIETEYNGYRFRSRLEARWAVFFDKMGIRYEYEPEGLVLGDGTYYLPDFYLPDFHCYFEVKRAGIENTPEGEEAIRKISSGMQSNEWAGIICFGDPMDNNLTLFCQSFDDDGGGDFETKIEFGLDTFNKNKPMLYLYEDKKDLSCADICADEDMHWIPVAATLYGAQPREWFVTKRVLEARKQARQARFEYGERPVMRK